MRNPAVDHLQRYDDALNSIPKKDTMKEDVSSTEQRILRLRHILILLVFS